MIAVMVFTTVSVVLLQHLTISYSSTRKQRDRVFAYMKAQSILAEMAAMVDANDDTAAIALEEFDDGATQNPVLTTDKVSGAPVAPDDPLSGNTLTSGGWKWYRKVSVRPFASLDNRSLRYVTVRIFQTNPNGRDTEVATLSSVINSLSASYPTAQVYDVYLLAVESVPGWWVYMENIVPSVEAAVSDLENRNPGLQLRTHWITKASYGRNLQYTPFVNSANDSNAIVPLTYYYPGRMPTGSASSYYYVPSSMRARINQDGTVVNGYDATTNPYPYALADFYNHAMRLPQEREWHELRVNEVQARKAAIAAAKAAGMGLPAELDDMSDEPTLRLFLEDLNTNPEKYRHALIVNLHGELLPMPAIRNYSDPAKSRSFPGARAVTHPEQLRTFRDTTAVNKSEDVYLRVYAWSAQPGVYHTGFEPTLTYIMVDIMDVDLRGPLAKTVSGTTTYSYYPIHADGFVRAMYGGTTDNGNNEYPPVGMNDPTFPSAKAYFEAPYPWPAGQPMRYYVYFGNLPNGRKFTRLYLRNTPLRCDPIKNTTTGATQGLFNNQQSRLYGLEYNPSPTRDKDFSRDLAAGGDGPKNTARWRIKIPATLLKENGRWYNEDGTPMGVPKQDLRLTVRTFIYDGSTPWPVQPGVMYPTPMSPDNLSETYTWWAATADAVPVTERSQFLGDPRFNPYKDLLNGDPDFGDGYNWFFNTFDPTVAADFPGIVNRFDGWDGRLRQDVPRFFEVLRDGLVKSKAIYTTLTGYSYYYIGHGNEIGYDSANGYPTSIPTQLRPFGDAADGTGYVDNITGFRRYIRDSRATTDYWWGMPWLGELYPDTAIAQWYAAGNLLAGNTGSIGSFYRQRDVDVVNNSTRFDPMGTTLVTNGTQRTGPKGCVSFMNNGNSTAHFNHSMSGASATLVGAGLELQSKYNFPLPTSIYTDRPFALNTGGNVPPEFNLNPYALDRHTATLLQKYYDRGAETGSGLVQLEDPLKRSAAFVVVSGLAPSAALGVSFIGKYSMLAMLQSYFEAGVLATTHRIQQQPRVEIRAPDELTELDNPTSVTVLWDTNWARWDNLPYTGTSPTVGENESDIEYSLMFSRDNGHTWMQLESAAGTLIDAGVPATPGTRPTNAAFLTPDSSFGQDSRTWSLPAASYPEGGYLIRIEAYRKNQVLHYSHHTQRFFIDRT